MTIMSEKELKKMQEELAKVIEEQRKENDFRPSLIKVLDASSEIIALERRAARLTDAIGVLVGDEEFDIPEEIHLRAEDLEDEAKIIRRQIEKKVNIALDEMNQEHLLRFAQMYFNIEDVPHFNYIVEHFTDEQKAKIYDILRSKEPKDQYDEHLIWRFEKAIGYSFAFAKEKGLIDLSDPQLEPFVAFLEKYITKYTEQIPATIEWLKTLSELNVSEKLQLKYADAAVRRLGIAERPEDEHYNSAIEDFKNILNRLMTSK